MRPKRPINADVPAPEEEPREQQSVHPEPEGGAATPQPGPPASPDSEPKAAPAPAPAEKRDPAGAPHEPGKQRKKGTGSAPKKPEPTRQPGASGRVRRPRAATPIVLAGLVVLAIVFIVVAIVGSGSGKDETATTAPAPAPAKTGGSEALPPQTAESLGYPSFATGNTTRVGGSDATATAAGVALAVFPSTTPAQRPAAVTLVGEEDWAGAIAGAVLMAPPVRAPILFSAAEAVPEATGAAVAALRPGGSRETGGASYFAIGAVASPAGVGKATPVDSGDAASTAAQIATLREGLAGGPPQALVVASSSNPDFAMPAAAWAARSGDPVLFAEPQALPQPTEAALKRHPKLPVYVLGPPAVISDQVMARIDQVAGRVKRVAGPDAVTTALALARYGDGAFGWNVDDPGHGFVLARSDSPLNAAAAAPLSASGTWGPLLLTDDAGRLPSQVRDYLLDVKPGYTDNPTRAFYNHVWVIGDEDAISVDQQAEVDELAELTKIGGEGE